MLKEDTWCHPNGCPKLFLAPMEGLGDGFFRRAFRILGGFDEACTEFLRVPKNAHIPSLAKRYDPHETAPYPQAAQLMGEDPELMAAMTLAVQARGAPRIDLNCGCPSNTVVGRGAGSSLLRTPDRLYEIVKHMTAIATVPISVKMRSGYSNTSLFKENLLAAEEAGAAWVTLHPRTKEEGYRLPCHWDLLAEAKEILSIPLVGSGEIKTAADAQRMHRETGCDGLMVGRGALADPWIFHRIKASYSNATFRGDWKLLESYLRHFASDMVGQLKERNRVNKLKQVVNFMLNQSDTLELRQQLLRQTTTCLDKYLNDILIAIRPFFDENLR